MTRFGRWRTTRLGALPLAAAVGLLLLSVLTGSSWLLLLAGASLGLSGAAFVLRPNVAGITCTVTGPARTAVGEAVTHLVHVHNTGGRTTSRAQVTLTLAGFADAVLTVDALLPGGAASVAVTRPAASRGIARHAMAEAVSSTPFGLLQARTVSLVPHPVLVHPQPVRPRRVPVGGAIGAADANAVVTRAGPDLHGIREWRTGDSRRDVHWRSSARRGRLVVVEREEPQQRALTMLIAGTPAADDWERLLAVAAATAAAVARSGRDVALLATHDGVARLTTGRPVDVLDWFAGLGVVEVPRADEVQRAFDAAGRGGDVVVAVSEALPADWWAWLQSGAAAQRVAVHRLTAASA
ncbi:MAG TPA: DUF58 domain-containing protein [Mycobacteriales bacterium]|nr:DUF58 domain-containing protein [Mycobacteriales bacterium]